MNLATGTLFTCFPTPKASVSALSSLVYGGAASRSRCKRLSFPIFCALKLKGAAEKVDEKNNSSGAVICAVGSINHQDEIPTTFIGAHTEQELLLEIKKEVEAGRLPLNIAKGMEELFHNYRTAVLDSGHPEAYEILLSNMAVVLERILMDVRDPFHFSPYHEAIREPFDYYIFGQQYIRPLVDFSNSYLGNASFFNEMELKLQQGENVILISNHQTEADPAVIALLLESTNSFIAENLIYVAGDRVLTDPLCKPFSKGRNLLCVYSKKHMNDDPELIDMKRRANTKSLKELAMLLRSGSKIIWIAPSGGRDRPDPATKEWLPTPFDAPAVDNMRRLAENSGVPANIYPLAILCYDIMPPPLKVEKEIGERRVISFHGVGLSAGPKIIYTDATATSDDPEEAKLAFTRSLYSSVLEQYDVLKSAIHGKQGFTASTSTVTLSQPWV